MEFEEQVVSVLVISYNSSRYIIDTLESIKNQSWKNISLIVSDDCSTDKTVDICEKWIERNKRRFVDTFLIQSKQNTGISANINRGEAVCNTRWIKSIGGDDLLLPNCIRDNMLFINEHPDVSFLFSRMLECHGNKISKSSSLKIDIAFFSLSIMEQYESLVFTKTYMPSPTFFYNMDVVRKNHLQCDERIPMWDDFPRWLNILKRGISLSFMDKETVCYRFHDHSVSQSSIHSVKFYRSKRLVYYYYLKDEYIKKMGKEKAIEMDVDTQVSYFSEYIKYRYLLSTKIYCHIKNFVSIFVNYFRKS